MTRRAIAPALALAVAFLSAAPAAAEPRAEADPADAPTQERASAVEAPPDALSLARRADELLRGRGSAIEATMTIVSGKRPRSRVLTLRLLDDRRNDRALVRVLAGEEESGVALLKLPPNLWEFSPRKRETTRIPASAWFERFLGSDFTRDDLVHGASGVDDYEHRFLGVDERAGEAGDRRAFVVEYTARAEASPGWARIVAWIDAEGANPLRLDYHAADGSLARTLRMDDVREVEGRAFPHLWVMRRTGAKSRETRIRIDSVRFDPDFDEGLFTTRRLASGG